MPALLGRSPIHLPPLPDPQSIAEWLVDVFGVETVVGLPRYTYHDWETRSDCCKQLGPDGVSGPHDDLYECDSWWRDDERVVPVTAPAPGGRWVGGQ